MVVRASGETTARTVLAEVFDLEPDNGRLTNLSTRGRVAAGNNLVSGFVVAGDRPKQYLIRAAGPRLTDLGVTEAAADPQLEINSTSGASLATNDDWSSSDSLLSSAVLRTGAFAFNAGSKDAALVVTLSPGAYTATVRSPSTVAGIVLLEIYEIP